MGELAKHVPELPVLLTVTVCLNIENMGTCTGTFPVKQEKVVCKWLRYQEMSDSGAFYIYEENIEGH